MPSAGQENSLDVMYRSYHNIGVTLVVGKAAMMSPKRKDVSPDAGERMIHVRLKAETHRRLRVHVAEQDRSIQDWVNDVIETELDRVEAKKLGRKRRG